jgi:hypothetical protein
MTSPPSDMPNEEWTTDELPLNIFVDNPETGEIGGRL